MFNKIKSFLKRHRLKFLIGVGVFLIWYAFCLPNPLFNTPTSVVLEDKDGHLLGARIAKDGQWRFPYNDSVPEKFAAALMEFEDRRFYHHIGVDIWGIGRAINQNIKHKRVVSGGSTLSMQVIRMARHNKPRNLWQKILEAILATRLELKYSKKEILAFHASNAPFGGNVVGLDAASWRYFGKQAHLLSWAEAATLAVLPNSPALIHPGRNRNALKEKRNRLLTRLLEQNKIDSLTWELALEEPLPQKPLPLPRLAPHLLDKISIQLRNKAASRFKSTIDLHLQQKINRIVQTHHRQGLKDNGIFNAAVIVQEVGTGDVLAYIGNVFQQENNEHGHEVDVITAPRSTGSILKPFLYAMMLEEGQLLPSNLLSDVPTQMKGYRPLNYYETYDGVISAKSALARSLNVPAVRMLQKYGLEKFHSKMTNMGISTFNKPADHYGLPLILGGAEGTLEEITNVYTAMARTLNHFKDHDGWYLKDDFRKNNYSKNHTTFSLSKPIKEAPHLSAASIFQTFDAMQNVQRPTSEGDWQSFESSQQIAWKTGTSFGFRDAWAVGVTPRYTVGVWVGNADGEGRPNLVGVLAAAPILFEVFELLDLENEWFEQPYDEMIQVPICRKSGYRALGVCQTVDSLWVSHFGLRSRPCPYHKRIHLDPTETYQVNSTCESPTNMIHRSWFVLPPIEEFYYKTKNPNYQVLPPFRADCKNHTNTTTPMQLIYPKRSTKIYVPINLDGEQSKTVFKVAHRKPKTTIYWHLNNEYIGSTETFHELALQPKVGKHILTLVDEKGFSLRREFEVIGKK